MNPCISFVFHQIGGDCWLSLYPLIWYCYVVLMKDKKEAYILILLTILNLILDINIVYRFKFDFVKYG